MQSRRTRSRRYRRLPAPLLAGVLAVALVAAASASAHEAGSKLKLPAERTSATGNFFTLEAYVAPTASKPVASFEMKVCTSKHTPPGTALEPAFFTLSLTRGGIVTESIALARHPAIVPKALAPLQCDEGWLAFNVPKGRTVSTLEYEYKSTISWQVG